LSAFDVILVGRYSEWQYYNSDHAFMAGHWAAAECITQDLVEAGAAETSVAS
jgi:UDP-galactopyranose mutase